jgi:hypothetical protein
VFHHALNGLVLLIVDGVEVDSLRPHLVFFAGSDKFWDQKTVRVASDVVHQTFGSVLGKKNGQISNNTVVSSFKTNSDFQK